jgi:hypothetical protein
MSIGRLLGLFAAQACGDGKCLGAADAHNGDGAHAPGGALGHHGLLQLSTRKRSHGMGLPQWAVTVSADIY